jgi:hypothetical protein
MKQLPAIFAAIIGAVAIVRTAEAGYMTGNDLHRYCSEASSFDSGVCFGFIAGAASVLIDIDSLIAHSHERLCVPQRQLRLDFIWLQYCCQRRRLHRLCPSARRYGHLAQFLT